MATHSSVLAWRIPGTGEPGGLPSMWSHRVGHDWSDLAAAAAAAPLKCLFSYLLCLYQEKQCNKNRVSSHLIHQLENQITRNVAWVRGDLWMQNYGHAVVTTQFSSHCYSSFFLQEHLLSFSNLSHHQENVLEITWLKDKFLRHKISQTL